jgi:hypothetical protein
MYTPPARNKGVLLGVAIPRALLATALPKGVLWGAVRREAGVTGVPAKKRG